MKAAKDQLLKRSKPARDKISIVKPDYIVIDPKIRFGKPRIRGTRITVADVAIRYLRMAQSLEEISGDFNLPPAALHAAMSYYYDHKAQIDAKIAAEERAAEKFRRTHPSMVRARSSKLTHA